MNEQKGKWLKTENRVRALLLVFDLKEDLPILFTPSLRVIARKLSFKIQDTLAKCVVHFIDDEDEKHPECKNLDDTPHNSNGVEVVLFHISIGTISLLSWMI